MAPTPEATMTLILGKVSAGQRFEDREVDSGLILAANHYVKNYAGRNSFVLSVRDQVVAKRRAFSVPQARGVLNVMLRDFAGQFQVTVAAPDLVVKTDAARLGTYTVVLDDGYRATLRVSPPKRPGVTATFIGHLVGPVNTADYVCVAVLGSEGFRWTKRGPGSFATPLGRCVAYLLNATDDQARECGVRWAMMSGECYVCGRTLTTPESIAAGIGPVCAGRL